MDKNLPAFLDSGAYTIACRFQKTSGESRCANYTFVTNIPGIRKGDFVVVATKNSSQTVALPGKMLTIAQLLDSSEDRDIFTAAPCDVIRGKLEVVEVVEVDKDVSVPPNSEIEYSWVIAKVDLGYFADLADRNHQIVATAKAAYTRNLRRSFADRILADMSPEDQLKLQALMSPANGTKNESE